ncbi:hypothetical protein GP486_005715, partial [Trichoglossum hirsutum]
MLRLRRYRTFLVFAIFTTFILYRFHGGQWTPEPPLLAEQHKDQVHAAAPFPRESVTETESYAATTSTAESTLEQAHSTSTEPTSKPTQGIAEPTRPQPDETSSTTPEPQTSTDSSDQNAVPLPALATKTIAHWSKLPENFPVPSESLIQLPSGKPKAIPKIQHVFSDESSRSRIERERKQATIKKLFKRAWAGYKERAWLQDELTPVSGKFRNTFCGWGATLVDGLDTLWIMGFEDEFKDALAALKEIDFTTSERLDIPLFETTIRYLGGLLGAYDVSGGKYSILVKKAVELADVLMGAFDTPNRMPITYYYWKPDFASQPHRASTKIVLAELGSLSVEFTRLSQITRDPKYFDAVQRITNELEKSQDKTRLPGLWPKYIDGSGCATQRQQLYSSPEHKGTGQAVVGPPTDATREDEVREGQKLSGGLADEVGAADVNGTPKDHSEIRKTQKDLPSKPKQDVIKKPPPPTMVKPLEDKPRAGNAEALDRQASAGKTEGHQLGWGSGGKELPRSGKRNFKRQSDADDHHDNDHHGDDDDNSDDDSNDRHCVPQGLESPPYTSADSFTLGAMADSLYEYFPKEFMLLGGQEQYRRMYEKSVEAAKRHIFFRPMTPTGRDILISGSISASDEGPHSLIPDGEHLGCFTGGMLAMGAKIFEREEDLAVGTKLTEGCVWAYESTASGIMPEHFTLIPCQTKDCAWNETRWLEAIASDYVEPYRPPPKIKAKPEAGTARSKPIANTTDAIEAAVPTPPDEDRDDEDQSESDDPAPPRTKEEIATEIINDTRLPPGYKTINTRGYLLRPEAIESVFILYRITGDSSWQTKGWKMFQAIENATTAEFGSSAINDVTVTEPTQDDKMESFFLAETLKYFYLLFSEPNVISLDDYVL